MTHIIPERYSSEDLYFYYDMDDVKLRWDHKKQKAYQKFIGETEFECNGWSYFNRAVNEGEEISLAEYLSE